MSGVYLMWQEHIPSGWQEKRSHCKSENLAPSPLNPAFGPTSQNYNFWKVLIDRRDCLSLVRANVSLAHRKHPGFEEISTSRWAQYILKLSRSNSEESYDLGKSRSPETRRRKKNTPFVQIKKIQNYIVVDFEHNILKKIHIFAIVFDDFWWFSFSILSLKYQSSYSYSFIRREEN